MRYARVAVQPDWVVWLRIEPDVVLKGKARSASWRSVEIDMSGTHEQAPANGWSPLFPAADEWSYYRGTSMSRPVQEEGKGVVVGERGEWEWHLQICGSSYILWVWHRPTGLAAAGWWMQEGREGAERTRLLEEEGVEWDAVRMLLAVAKMGGGNGG